MIRVPSIVVSEVGVVIIVIHAALDVGCIDFSGEKFVASIIELLMIPGTPNTDRK